MMSKLTQKIYSKDSIDSNLFWNNYMLLNFIGPAHNKSITVRNCRDCIQPPIYMIYLNKLY